MIRGIKLFLCKIGVHRPMRMLGYLFMDGISGRAVYDYECECGRQWMSHPSALFRVAKGRK